MNILFLVHKLVLDEDSRLDVSLLKYVLAVLINLLHIFVELHLRHKFSENNKLLSVYLKLNISYCHVVMHEFWILQQLSTEPEHQFFVRLLAFVFHDVEVSRST